VFIVTGLVGLMIKQSVPGFASEETSTVIGTFAAYVRYWLPLYVALGAGVIGILRRMWPWSKTLTTITIVAVLASQLWTTVFPPTAGLRVRYNRAAEVATKQAAIRSLTPSNSLIIAGEYDKYFVDDRLVGYTLPTAPGSLRVLQGVLQQRPVYLYVTPQQYGLQDIDARLAVIGAQVTSQEKVGQDQLWRIQ